MKRRFCRFIVAILVFCACIAVMSYSIDINAVILTLHSANYYLIFSAFVCTLVSYLLRAWRWRYFFRDVSLAPSYYNLVRCLFVGFFMNNVLPARTGEIVRAHVGGRHSSEGRTEVLATIASERLMDGLVISLIFAIFFSLDSSMRTFDNVAELFWIADFFILAAVGVFLMLAFREKIFPIISTLSSKFSSKFIYAFVDKFNRFLKGLEPLFHLKKLAIVVPMSCMVWGCELFVYFLISKAFHQCLSIGSLGLFLAAVNFSSLIPATPGGVGVIEFFSTVALVKIGINKEAALAMVAMQHLIQVIAVGIPGSIFLHGTVRE